LFRIIEKEDLGNKVYGFVVKAPRIAAKAQPGQFFIVRQGDGLERIPLTIADFDRGKETITMVFQVVGASTAALSLLEPGDEVTIWQDRWVCLPISKTWVKSLWSAEASA